MKEKSAVWYPEGVSESNRETIEKYKQAFAIVLNDAPKEKVDAIFFHTMSFGDDEEMFPLVAKFLAEGKSDYTSPLRQDSNWLILRCIVGGFFNCFKMRQISTVFFHLSNLML